MFFLFSFITRFLNREPGPMKAVEWWMLSDPAFKADGNLGSLGWPPPPPSPGGLCCSSPPMQTVHSGRSRFASHKPSQADPTDDMLSPLQFASAQFIYFYLKKFLATPTACGKSQARD